ncbi:MAG TPA: hypothetical protein VM070_09165 [Candidatus Saccharimonadales bacterium]|nr:hypothetical protein [Candidatus Saccharimonadales bacterium]
MEDERGGIGPKEIALAVQHPRGTEQRRLAPYRAALNDLAAYAALPLADRDVIVRWAETRRQIRDEHGVDQDPANFADPLIPAARLTEHVLAGERLASGATPDAGGAAGDLVAAVGAIRGAGAR